MAETLLENKICNKCGVDIRQGATFCYNCGSSISAEIPATEKSEDIGLPQSPGGKVLQFKKETITKSETNGNSDLLLEKPEPESELATGKPKLQSAASMRRKPKTIQKKRVEIAWEEPESAPNLWFIAVAAVLILFAVGLWYIATSLE